MHTEQFNSEMWLVTYILCMIEAQCGCFADIFHRFRWKHLVVRVHKSENRVKLHIKKSSAQIIIIIIIINIIIIVVVVVVIIVRLSDKKRYRVVSIQVKRLEVTYANLQPIL